MRLALILVVLLASCGSDPGPFTYDTSSPDVQTAMAGAHAAVQIGAMCILFMPGPTRVPGRCDALGATVVCWLPDPSSPVAECPVRL